MVEKHYYKKMWKARQELLWNAGRHYSPDQLIFVDRVVNTRVVDDEYVSS